MHERLEVAIRRGQVAQIRALVRQNSGLLPLLRWWPSGFVAIFLARLADLPSGRSVELAPLESFVGAGGGGGPTSLSSSLSSGLFDRAEGGRGPGSGSESASESESVVSKDCDLRLAGGTDGPGVADREEEAEAESPRESSREPAEDIVSGSLCGVGSRCSRWKKVKRPNVAEGLQNNTSASTSETRKTHLIGQNPGSAQQSGSRFIASVINARWPNLNTNVQFGQKCWTQKS